MPRYNISCMVCRAISDYQCSFDQYDAIKQQDYLETECAHCQIATPHRFVIVEAPSVEWRTDGAYSYDNADQFTRYQRQHFAESGDRSDKKLAERRRRRPDTARL